MSYTVDTIELKKLMAENGIDTFTELAEKADLSRDTVSGVLKGKIRPSTNVMDKLMIALNIKQCDAGKIFFVPNLRNA